MVRVGVSGHRVLNAPDQDDLIATIDAVLDELGDPGIVVSSIAEGADRLVAWRALRRPGWDLVVVLPLAPDDYAADFTTGASREEFARLLDAAAEIEQVTPRPERVEAYLAAGVRMLERSDALIAVWDGEPARGRGGTAEIVARARALHMPMTWIHSATEHPAVTRERWRWAS